MQTTLDRILSLKGDMNLDEFASHIDFPRAELDDCVAGKLRVSDAFLRKVSMKYGVSTHWLLGMTEYRAIGTDPDPLQMMVRLCVALLEAEQEIAALTCSPQDGRV